MAILWWMWTALSTSGKMSRCRTECQSFSFFLLGKGNPSIVLCICFTIWQHLRFGLACGLPLLVPQDLRFLTEECIAESGQNYPRALMMQFFFLFERKQNGETNTKDFLEFRIKQMSADKIVSRNLFEKQWIFSLAILNKQMFPLISIHFTYCLIYDLSFEGIHGREWLHLSTCCASICLGCWRICTNYIFFVKLWVTEAFAEALYAWNDQTWSLGIGTNWETSPLHLDSLASNSCHQRAWYSCPTFMVGGQWSRTFLCIVKANWSGIHI